MKSEIIVAIITAFFTFITLYILYKIKEKNRKRNINDNAKKILIHRINWLMIHLDQDPEEESENEYLSFIPNMSDNQMMTE